MSDSSYIDFGIGDNDQDFSGKFQERFKPKANEQYRVSLAWWPLKDGAPDLDAKSPNFVGAKRYYIPNVGYILDDKSPELYQLSLTAHGGDAKKAASKMYAATVIVLWPIDRKGNLSTQRILDGEYEVKPWVFTRKTYDTISDRHNTDWPLGKHDLSIKCAAGEFQQLDIVGKPDNVLRTLLGKEAMRKITDVIFKTVDDIVGPEKASIKREIARPVPLDVIRSKLGLSTPSLNNTEAAADIDNIMTDFEM